MYVHVCEHAFVYIYRGIFGNMIYVAMYMYFCACVYEHEICSVYFCMYIAYVHICIVNMHMCMGICICVCMCLSTYLCKCRGMFLYMYCEYACVFLYVCIVHVCIYT